MTGSGAADTQERNLRLFAGPFGAIYSRYMERPCLAAFIARVAWNSDIGPFFESMRAVHEVPDGETVIDAPCGAGVAFRAVPRDREIRYLAFDLSPVMTDRARQRARALGLHQVRVAEADAAALPVAGETAELFLSYFGLHCFPDPKAAVQEFARCLRPGGRVVGGSIVRGTRPLDRFRVTPGKGAFGPVGTTTDLRGWLRDAGLEGVSLEQKGVFAYFEARKPAG